MQIRKPGLALLATSSGVFTLLLTFFMAFRGTEDLHEALHSLYTFWLLPSWWEGGVFFLYTDLVLADVLVKALVLSVVIAFVALESFHRGMNPILWSVLMALGIFSFAASFIMLWLFAAAAAANPILPSVAKPRQGFLRRTWSLTMAYLHQRHELDSLEDESVEEQGNVEGAHITNELFRDASMILFFMAVLFFVSSLLPPPLHTPADPYVQAGWILPDWYLLWSYGLLKLGGFLGSQTFPLPLGLGDVQVNALFWGSQLSGVFMIVLFVLPLIDKGGARRPIMNPIQASLGLGYLVFATALTVYAFNMIWLYYFPFITDAMLRFIVIVPPFVATGTAYAALRNKGSKGGYEYEMNLCYQCDLCEDVCPITKVEAGPNPDGVDTRNSNLNLVYNIWQGRHDGVAMGSCLSCDACSQVCPQDKEYSPYVLAQRTDVEWYDRTQIPHQVLSHVLEAELEETDPTAAVVLPSEMVAGKDKIAYYPGCVDYYDMEMKFSHENSGAARHGQIADAALRVMKHVGLNPVYLDRAVFKCCGHDQLWQGRTKAFEEFRRYNLQLFEQSGLDIIVCTCAECTRAFKIDYNLQETLGIRVMHFSEFMNEFDQRLQFKKDLPTTTVTYHDPCRLSRHLGIINEPRNLIHQVPSTRMVEMERSRENSMCCGISSMMYCNERTKAIRTERVEEAMATGAQVMLLGCPKCYTHFECLKHEDWIKGEPDRHSIQFKDLAVFLAERIDEAAPPSLAPAPTSAELRDRTVTHVTSSSRPISGPPPASKRLAWSFGRANAVSDGAKEA